MRFVLRAAAIGLTVALATGCGSGGDSDGASGSGQTRPSASKPAPPADPGSEGSGGSKGSGGGDGSAYCEKVHEFGDQQDPLGALAAAQSENPDGTETLRRLAHIYAELAEVAPGEIKAELEGARDLFAEVVAVVDSGATTAPELEAQAPKLAEWGVTIQEYTAEHCA